VEIAPGKSLSSGAFYAPPAGVLARHSTGLMVRRTHPTLKFFEAVVMAGSAPPTVNFSEHNSRGGYFTENGKQKIFRSSHAWAIGPPINYEKFMLLTLNLEP
jgi:hypothetical protein